MLQEHYKRFELISLRETDNIKNETSPEAEATIMCENSLHLCRDLTHRQFIPTSRRHEYEWYLKLS